MKPKCGKTRYETRSAAKQGIRSHNHHCKKKATYPYFCEPCDGWHITTVDKGHRATFRELAKKGKI